MKIKILASITMILLGGPEALAYLGGTSDSIKEDQSVLSSSTPTSKSQKDYSISELDLGGSQIREYISSSGIIFGIAWSGNSHPKNINQLLGKYKALYLSAMGASPKGHGHRTSYVKSQDLVVQMWGHPRNLRGRAYATSLLPQGVKSNEIN